MAKVIKFYIMYFLPLKKGNLHFGQGLCNHTKTRMLLYVPKIGNVIY